MVKKKKLAEVTEITQPVALVEVEPRGDLKSSLEQVKTCEGIIGYIVRNSKTATVDLADPTRITDYAILSSLSLDAGVEISQLLDLGPVESLTITGNNAKMLSLTIEDNKVAVFMEKATDSEMIMRKLRSTNKIGSAPV